MIRQPFAPGDLLPFWAGHGRVDHHHLYDLDVDPDEAENRAGEAVEAEMVELLRTRSSSSRPPTTSSSASAWSSEVRPGGRGGRRRRRR